MAVRSKVLATISSAPVAVVTTIYTCPAERTAIVKDLRLVNMAGAARSVALWLRRGATDYRLVVRDAMPARAVHLETDVYIVLGSGDRIGISLGNESASTSVDAILCGVELAGVAPA